MVKGGYLVLHNEKSHVTADNVLSVLVHDGDEKSLCELITSERLLVIGIFHWDSGSAREVYDVFNKYGTQQNSTSWLFRNTPDVMFELGTILRVFRGELPHN